MWTELRLLAFAALPLSVAIAFLVHWRSLRKIENAADRLPLCRGAYLAFSAQLLLFAWLLHALLPSLDLFGVLIAVAMSFSAIGDFFNLRFPAIEKRLGESVYFGILSFMIAQACYLAAFLLQAPLESLWSGGFLLWLLLGFTIAPALVFRLRVFNRERPRNIMNAAFVYGILLGAVVAVSLSAAIALGGAWLWIGAGMLFFLLSDAVMGETTIYGRHPRHEFQIPWFTYLIAQGLILIGSALLRAGS